MYVLAVVGPEGAGRPDLVDRLVDALGDDGPVAVASTSQESVGTHGGSVSTHGGSVSTHGGSVGTPGESVDPSETGIRRVDDRVRTNVAVGPDGWVASGSDRTLGDVLDDLAPTHDSCVLDDVAEATVPGVVLDGASHGGEVLASADVAADIDVPAVVEALRERQPHETLESLVERAKQAPDADLAGAVATFTGRVRARDHPDDERTTHLEFETYEGVAEERMDAIEAELEEREGVYEVVMHHRTGVVAAGEDIVFVVVLAGHRPEAFETVSDGIDRLKDEVPIFKKETTTGEEFWVHARDPPGR